MFIVLLNMVVISIIIGIAIFLTLVAITLIIISAIRSSLAKRKNKKTHKVGLWIGLTMLIIPWLVVAAMFIYLKVYQAKYHYWDGSELQDEIVAAVIDKDEDDLADMMAESQDISKEEVEDFLDNINIDNDSEDDIKRYTSNWGEYRNDFHTYNELIIEGEYKPKSETHMFFAFYMHDINDDNEDLYIAGVHGDSESEEGVGIYYMVLLDDDGNIIDTLGSSQTWTKYRSTEVEQQIIDMTLEAGYEPKNQDLLNNTFMSQNGLTVSMQKDFDFETAQNDGEQDISEFEVNGDVLITEKAQSDKEGYKEITCFFTLDMSQKEEDLQYSAWVCAFDRYTGTAFAPNPENINENGLIENDAEFDYENNTFDIHVEYGYQWTEEIHTLVICICVTCPEDYDGTVFQVGYADMEMNEANAQLDYDGNTYTIDQLPGFDTNGHQYFYFTESNA